MKRTGKSIYDASNDMSIVINQNAKPPGPYTMPEILLRYLSVNPDGTPLLTTMKPERDDHKYYESWSSKDYLDLPDAEQQYVDYMYK